jgi:hypothetical protein
MDVELKQLREVQGTLHQTRIDLIANKTIGLRAQKELATQNLLLIDYRLRDLQTEAVELDNARKEELKRDAEQDEKE